MDTRCKECVFKDFDGGKYPCNDCNEIMDIQRLKCKKNYFKQIDKHDKEIISKERLKGRLDEVATSTNKEIIYSEYGELEDGNITLTSFLNDGKDIAIYQIADLGNRLVQNVVWVDRKFINIK